MFLANSAGIFTDTLRPFALPLRLLRFTRVKAKHEMSLPEKGNFLVDDTYTFEVGGKSKSAPQYTDMSNSYVVKGDMGTGSSATIPLWLLGLLY